LFEALFTLPSHAGRKELPCFTSSKKMNNPFDLLIDSYLDHKVGIDTDFLRGDKIYRMAEAGLI